MANREVAHAVHRFAHTACPAALCWQQRAGLRPPSACAPTCACVARSPSNTSGASQRGFVTAVLLRSLGASSSRRLQAGPERVAQLVRVLCNLLTGLVRSWDRAISGGVSHHIASLLQPSSTETTCPVAQKPSAACAPKQPASATRPAMELML
ncbi:hypothetical protein ABPG77_005606 [Micractinium sp. CCAP 211/92]